MKSNPLVSAFDSKDSRHSVSTRTKNQDQAVAAHMQMHSFGDTTSMIEPGVSGAGPSVKSHGVGLDQGQEQYY